MSYGKSEIHAEENSSGRADNVIQNLGPRLGLVRNSSLGHVFRVPPASDDADEHDDIHVSGH